MNRRFVPECISDQMAAFFTNGVTGLFDHGVEIQHQVLDDIIALGAHSQYAKDHGFYDIKSREAFFENVPISEYKDYVAYIEDNMTDDAGQVIGMPTEYYLLSTGGAFQGKYYIETRLGALARQLTIDFWNLHLMKTEEKMTQPDVKMMAITNCAPIESAPNGKVVRRTSSQAAKGLWEKHPDLYVFPYEFLEAEMADKDRDYMIALYALYEKQLDMLFCNNLGYFGDLLDCIEHHPLRMIEDIRQGTFSVDLRPQDRVLLEGLFEANPERADELEAIYEEDGCLTVEKIWPRFKFTGTWLAGTVGDYARDVQKRLPEDMRYYSESYGTSEVMINIPLTYDATYGPLAVYSCFFEFMPLGENDPKKLLTIEDLEDGAYYEIIVTTYSGLYRYNLRDIVRVCGFTGNTPNIEFCCRCSENIALEGRTFYGHEFIGFMKQLEEETAELFAFYQAFVEEGRLSLVIQCMDSGCDWIHICRKVRALAERVGIAVKNIYFVSPAYRAALYEQLKKNGRTVQCIKLPMLAKKAPDEAFVHAIYEVQ